MPASVLRKNDMKKSIWAVKYTKNKTGDLQDYKVPCDCNNVTKFIKTSFSRNFYWRIIYLLQISAAKFSENNNKTLMIPICN